MNSHLDLERRAGIDGELRSSYLQKDSVAKELDNSTLARRWLTRFPSIISLYSRISGAIANLINLSIILDELRIRISLYSNSKLRKALHEHSTCISIYLRESLRYTEIILLKNAFFQKRLQYRRNQTLDDLSLKNHIGRFDFEQQQEYSMLVSQDKRSRILACYHFGDFVYAMNYIVSLEAISRKGLLLSQSEATSQYFDNMERAFGKKVTGTDSQIICSKLDITRLSSLLRKGNSTLVLFCDLPNGYGEQVRVKFLNRSAWFPKGPAVLALVNKVPLLPSISYYDGKRHKIELANQIEPYTLNHESLEDGVIRITQELVDFFEYFLYRYPEQWRFLQKLPLYFLKGNAAP